jgi:hypothetical protein
MVAPSGTRQRAGTAKGLARYGRWAAAWPLVLKVAGVTVFTLLLAIGLLYVRLLHGPISLTFLAGPVERGIAEEFAGINVRIEDVAVRLTEAGHVEFELKNVRVADAANSPLAVAPSAAIAISRKALLMGRIAPESVDLISPRLLIYYNEEGALSVTFSPPLDPDTAVKLPALRGASQAALAMPAVNDADWALGRIDLVKALSEASARARRHEHAGAYLREVGLKSATVIVDGHNRKSIWHLQELAIDLDHENSRSSIAGRAKIQSLSGPWEVNFRTFEAESANTLQLAVSVQGLVPRGLARTLPQFAGLENLDMPIWAEAQLDLSSTGEILAGTIGVDAAAGHITVPGMANPLPIDGGHLALSYSGSARRFEIAPSVLVWGDSRVQFTGSVAHTAAGAEGPRWTYELKSAGGWIGAEPPARQSLPIDDWSAHGFLALDRGQAVLRQFVLRAGGSEITAQGEMADMAGAMRTRLEGRIGPMRADVFKALWPRALATKSHDWVVHQLVRGTLQSGAFKLVSGPGGDKSPGGADRISLTLEGSDLALAVVDAWPTLDVPRALLRIDGQSLEIIAPDAVIAAPDGRRLAFKGSFAVELTDAQPRIGRLAFKGQGPASLLAELIDKEPLNALQGSGVAPASVEGKFEGQFNVVLPLDNQIQPHDVKVAGKARISDGRLKQALGPLDIHGANISIELSETAVEGRGEMLLNGVLAKSSWQYVFDTAPEKQPPLRITATLDNSDRTQLGLDINDLVQGDVGMEVIITRTASNERQVHVRADLANAELSLDSVAWSKPRGKASLFEFDVVKGTHHPLELQNVKLVGDNIAVEGWMGLGSDHKVKEFHLPHFSLNVIGSLETNGKLRSDNVWEVTAKGPFYDGRDLFRSFFDVARVSDANGNVKPGLDLRAEIDTVMGFSDSRLRNVHMTLLKRGDRLVGLDARGVLDGGKVFTALVHNEPGQARRLQAEATDAGQIFKVVGFYPNAIGGQMNLEVFLDGQGAAERTGTLWARDFAILGDPIVSEVLQNVDGVVTQGRARRAVVREKFDFENLRIPFSVGHGQFVMHNAYINGPLVGATMRGRVDFRTQMLNVGGTYVPLSGINRALAPVPVLGPLLTGPRGEGLFGITFAIQGSLANPQVVVNPFSLVTPGILREIMQMTPEDPHVLPNERPVRIDNASRASSSPATGGGSRTGSEASRVAPDIAGGWSAQTTDSAAKR